MKKVLLSLFILVLLAVSLGYLFAKRLRIEPEKALRRAGPKAKIEHEKEAMFYEKLTDKKVRCQVCFRKCIIPNLKRGYCRNRENQNGVLYNLVYGQPSAVHIDPIEKEPQFHVLPGSKILCLGTAGCNLRCLHCHNWHLSQSSIEDMYTYKLNPKAVVELALKKRIPTISFTYNEPTSFYEYVYDIARLAKKNGLKIIWHSNGTMNPEPLKELLKYTDAVTIDLKGFSKRAYDNSSGVVGPVLETLKSIKKAKVHLEIVNLVIPGINDSPEEIRKMCEWIKENLGTNVPLHFSRFFPSYKLMNLPPTPVSTLENAFKIAKEVGINYVTIGNLPGHKFNSTFCPSCGKKLIDRVHFEVRSNNIERGKCKFCGQKITGIWE